MRTLTKNTKRDERREFAIKNNLLTLVDQVISERKAIALMDLLGIKVCLCIDMDAKDEFFELSGLMIDGKHNNDLNRMEFKITEI